LRLGILVLRRLRGWLRWRVLARLAGRFSGVEA
jgi:hypothetical protein